jgi:hypothetical protein
MKTLWTVALSLVVLCAMVVAVKAADEPKTLKGTLVCAKCTLGEADKCTNALQVKEGDKTVTYLIEDKGKDEDFHKKICPKDKKVEDVEVKGIVFEKDGKKWIKEAKVKLPS